MSEEKKQLVDKYTPEIKKLLESGDQEAYNTLKKLDEEMMELNVKENKLRSAPIQISDRCPPVDPIKRKGEKRRRLLAIMNDSNRDRIAREDAMRDLQDEQREFYDYMEAQHIPVGEVYNIPHITFASQPSSAGNRQTSNPRTAAGSSTSQSSDAMDITHDWSPGETTRGRKILAVRSIKLTGRSVHTGELDQLYKRQEFVVEKEEGSNSMEILTSFDVGRDAVKAYNQLSEDQRWEIAGIEKKFDPMDRERFDDEIQGVAWHPNAKTDINRPWTVVKINIDGIPRIVNLTTLRSVRPKREADEQVDNFCIQNNLNPPWLHGTGRQIDDGTRRSGRRELQGRDRRERPMLPEREEYDGYAHLGERSFPRGGRERTSENSERLRSRHSRPYEMRDRRERPMLPETEEYDGYAHLGERSFPRGGRERSLENSERRPYEMRDPALNISREPHQTNGAHRQRPPPVRDAPPVPPLPRTRTTDILPGNVREEQHQMGAAVGGQYITNERYEEGFQTMMQMIRELTVKVDQNLRAQEPVAAAG